jgi:hypothetical protein
MCKRVLRRALSSPPARPGRQSSPPGAPAPDALPPPPRLPGEALLELADVPRAPRRLSQPPRPPNDAPGSHPYAAKRLSSRPPPPVETPRRDVPPEPERSALARGLEALATALAAPLDRLVAASTRPSHLSGRHVSIAAYLRLSLLLHAAGAFLLAALPWRSFDAIVEHRVQVIGGAAGLLAVSFAARFWVERSRDRSKEPSALALALLTFLPWTAMTALVVSIVGSLLGELRQPNAARGIPEVFGITRDVAIGLGVLWVAMVAGAGVRNLLRR